ncbi:MAG TPA: type II toxin-antitoxin system VapC family toxin [Nocardioidaceae bacterium]|nr:type II toxin-antitoxin system VapC family toxin [Nocardioidaceae bacterium]
MPTSAEPLLLDTSAAIALVQPNHAKHAVVRAVVRGRSLGLAGHAELETYSVLTRLPAPQRLTPATALRLIRTNFPHTKRLTTTRAAGLLDELVELNLAGGSTYDALVALTARHHDLTLLSADTRAADTYRALAIDFTLV